MEIKINIEEKLYNEILKNSKDVEKFIIDSIKESLSKKNVKVFVLCGGEGTRMRPLTYTIPKPMLPLGTKPVLQKIVEFFSSQGFNNFVFGVGYLGEVIVKYFGDGSRLGVNIEYSFEREALGTGGAMKNAKEKLSETFIVTNGDVIFGNGLNLHELLNFHFSKDVLGTIVAKKVERSERFGVIEFDENFLIKEFKEKVQMDRECYINAGIYVLNKEVLNYIPENKNVSIEKEIFPLLIKEGKLAAFPYDGYWIDIGIPEDYVKALMDMINNK